jgi:hypothetical protein
MSCTEIYAVIENGDVKHHDEIRNAWRGAPAVWNDMGKRYGKMGAGQLMYQPSVAEAVWGLARDKSVPEDERLVMASTFDRVVIMRKDFPRLIDAMEKFIKKYSDTSIGEQADIIRKMQDDSSIIGVCWNQTSVNSSPWMRYGTDDEEGRPYNINTDEGHWSPFDDERYVDATPGISQ